jgi:DNA (cytosine-5)-methyltransferase 1
MRYGSVCSGVEAASLAWEPLGWQPQWFSEIEAFPSAVLQHHWPDVENIGDMTSEHFRSNATPVDLLVGGTPCQSFSVAGLRGGLDDERGNLALEFCRIVDQLTPRWVVWENVPGVLSSNGGRDFGSIVGAMAEIGYNVAWRILDAQFFRTPQRRRRIFLVGHLGADERGATAVLLESHSLQGHSPPSREKGQDLAPAVTSGPEISGPIGSNSGGFRTTDLDNSGAFVPVMHQLSGPLAARDYKVADTDGITPNSAKMVPIWRAGDQANAETYEDMAGTLNCNKGQQGGILFNGSMPMSELAGTVTARKGRNGGASNDDVTANHLICVNARETPVSMSDKDLSLGAQDRGHAVATQMQVRRLTPRECERLQGMPDDHTRIPWRGKPAEECPDTPRYKAIGNSMAVPVMRWIGERIQMVDELLNNHTNG